MGIAIICFLVHHIINFEIILNFLYAAFLHDQKKGKNLNILRAKRDFTVILKIIFHHFLGPSAARNCLRPDSACLRFGNSKI